MLAALMPSHRWVRRAYRHFIECRSFGLPSSITEACRIYLQGPGQVVHAEDNKVGWVETELRRPSGALTRGNSNRAYCRVPDRLDLSYYLSYYR